MVELRAFFNEKHFWRYFFALVIIYLIAYGALIRGDIYYSEDWWRSFLEQDLGVYSRFVAKFLFRLATLFKHIDIAPLTQILAFFILALSSLIIIHSSNHKLNFFNIIALAPLALSPFFAQIISYRFDSLTISFSIFFAVLPFLFSRKILIFCVISVISLILMYCTYQASSGVYLVIGLYLALQSINQSSELKSALKFLGAMFASFTITSMFYKLIIVEPVTLEVEYISDSALPLEYLFIGVFRNLAVYFYNLLYFLQSMPFLYFSFGLILFFIFGAISEDSKNRAKSFIASILFIVCALSLSYGAYLVLLKPLMAPRAFIGFGAFVAVVSLFCVNFQNKIPSVLSKILVICSTYSLIVFLNAYGNAITAQEKYINFRNSILLHDLSIYAKNTENSGITYIGDIGFAPQTQRFFDVYGGIAEELIPNVGDYYLLALARLKHMGSAYDRFDLDDGSLITSGCYLIAPFTENKRLLLETAYHDIYETESLYGEKCYLIEYKNIRTP